ncbi:MAG: dihydroorotate dehydrogenase [Pirellulaceae bacterium]|nr:MAG: dihydroorotate dehydrogenase [Pirellulaceae bacterium]
MEQPAVDLSVSLGRLQLPNPITVASGTFGYIREMEGIVDVGRLGAVIPKTVTWQKRLGNAPWRTVETAAGLLNSIGLDNDGIDYFLAEHLPYLRRLPTKLIVSIAGRTADEFARMAERLEAAGGVAALELNISCPNVAHGTDFGADPVKCAEVVRLVRSACDLPVIAKLSPNVTSIVEIAEAAEQNGADAVSMINTVLGMAVDWRRRRPLLGNVLGGLSGPAVKPIALRCVYQVRSRLSIPIMGIGGIASIDDVMEFIVAGASAVQVGTANYYDPQVTLRLVTQLPGALQEAGVTSVRDLVGTLRVADEVDRG